MTSRPEVPREYRRQKDNLCWAEVDDVHDVALLSMPDEEVVRLDVAVDEIPEDSV